MARIDKALEAKLKSSPDVRLCVIVRTSSPPAQHTATLEAYGLRVVRVSTLINAMTVEGSAKEILKLSAQNWVMALESDGTVHTMGKH